MKHKLAYLMSFFTLFFLGTSGYLLFENEISYKEYLNYNFYQEDIKDVKVEKRKKQYEEILYPIVKIKTNPLISGASGSGVVIYSKKQDNGDISTYILTCYHVVKEFNDRMLPIYVEFPVYNKDQIISGWTSKNCKIVYFNEERDLSIIEIENENDVYPFTARLFNPELISDIKLFDDILIVGCPLGLDPYLTKGNLSSKNKKLINNQVYWLSNSDIYFGNSGGGVFIWSEKRNRYELIGISGLIIRGIPHLGAFIPIDEIKKFINDREGNKKFDELR
jgi:hypothetical protein